MSDRHRSVAVVALAVTTSRFLGLVRELVFVAMFGAGKFLDSFIAAFQIPNLFRNLFAEGALSTAFTATFSKTLHKEDETLTWRLANLLLTAVLLIMGTVCLLGIVASPLIVRVLNFGFNEVPGKFELTVTLTRALFPFILLVSLASVVMGILNARFIFGLPAMTSPVFNVVSMVSSVVLAYAFDPQPDWRAPHFTEKALYGLVLGVLLGGLAQLAMQLPALWRLGYRFRFQLNFRDTRLRYVWALTWPSMIAGATVQFNVLINGMFASEINGARVWLNCAFRLMQYPVGIFGVAIATVTLPLVAHHHARRELDSIGRTVEEALRLALFLTVPTTAGLIVLAPDIVRVIYEHGEFTAGDTWVTAMALRAYLLGLCGYVAIKVLIPCFYAMDRRMTPLYMGLGSIAACLILNFLVMKYLRASHVGLALITGILALVNAAQLAYYLRQDVAYGRLRRWIGFAVTVGASALVCGMSVWFLKRTLAEVSDGLGWRIFALLLTIAAGTGLYLLTAWLLRVDEIHQLARMLRRVLAKTSARPERT